MSYRVIPCHVPHRPPWIRVIACRISSGFFWFFEQIWLSVWPKNVAWDTMEDCSQLVHQWLLIGIRPGTVEKRIHDPEDYSLLYCILYGCCVSGISIYTFGHLMSPKESKDPKGKGKRNGTLAFIMESRCHLRKGPTKFYG